MHPELPDHIAPLARPDQLAMGEAPRMQRAVNPFLPELDEFEQLRTVRRQIVVLPDEAVDHIPPIRTPAERFGRGQPLALQHHFGLFSTHGHTCEASSFGRRCQLGNSFQLKQSVVTVMCRQPRLADTRHCTLYPRCAILRTTRCSGIAGKSGPRDRHPRRH